MHFFERGMGFEPTDLRSVWRQVSVMSPSTRQVFVGQPDLPLSDGEIAEAYTESAAARASGMGLAAMLWWTTVLDMLPGDYTTEAVVNCGLSTERGLAAAPVLLRDLMAAHREPGLYAVLRELRLMVEMPAHVADAMMAAATAAAGRAASLLPGTVGWDLFVADGRQALLRLLLMAEMVAPRVGVACNRHGKDAVSTLVVLTGSHLFDDEPMAPKANWTGTAEVLSLAAGVMAEEVPELLTAREWPITDPSGTTRRWPLGAGVPGDAPPRVRAALNLWNLARLRFHPQDFRVRARALYQEGLGAETAQAGLWMLADLAREQIEREEDDTAGAEV